MQNPVKTVLIVDDSRIFRGVVEKALEPLPGIKVIGSVRNGQKALEFLRERQPDIITLDVEMPELDGLATLHEIQKLLPEQKLRTTCIIMISSFTTRGAQETIDALEAGAYDFITKPKTSEFESSIALLRGDLERIITSFSGMSARRKPVIRRDAPAVERTRAFAAKAGAGKYKALLIGISTGGPKTLASLMPELTAQINLPILIVQHMPPNFTAAMAKSLNEKCPNYTIVEGGDGMRVEANKAYVAPGGKHMTITGSASGAVIKLNTQPPEESCRPSVNVLFRSAVPVYGGSVIAMILTGMGSDGSRSLGALKRAGAYIIAQDEKSSTVWGMPGSAVATGFVDEALPVTSIAGRINKLV